MKKRIQRVMSFIVLVALFTTAFPNAAFASTIDESSLIEPRGPQYIYQTEYLPQREVSVSGYAGNQSGSEYLTPGAGMYYSSSGGPTISTSLTLQFTYGVASVSVSAAIGAKTSTAGVFVPLGADQPSGYYKLKLTKTILIEPYVVYRKRSGAENTTWEIDHTGYVIVSNSAYPKTRGTLVYISA